MCRVKTRKRVIKQTTMKHYNIQNYIRYKTDLEKTIARIKIKEHYSLYDRNKLVVL